MILDIQKSRIDSVSQFQFCLNKIGQLKWTNMKKLKNQFNYLEIIGKNISNSSQLKDFINFDDHTAMYNFLDDDDTYKVSGSLMIQKKTEQTTWRLWSHLAEQKKNTGQSLTIFYTTKQEDI